MGEDQNERFRKKTEGNVIISEQLNPSAFVPERLQRILDEYCIAESLSDLVENISVVFWHPPDLVAFLDILEHSLTRADEHRVVAKKVLAGAIIKFVTRNRIKSLFHVDASAYYQPATTGSPATLFLEPRTDKAFQTEITTAIELGEIALLRKADDENIDEGDV